jgi:hypothetical protein
MTMIITAVIGTGISIAIDLEDIIRIIDTESIHSSSHHTIIRHMDIRHMDIKDRLTSAAK